MDEVHLSRQEALDLVHSIIEGIDHVEGHDLVSSIWPQQMRDWCVLLLDRLDPEEPT